MAEYRIAKRARVCAKSGEEFKPGSMVVSVIFQGQDGFERHDVSEECFEGADRAFSFWRTRVPESLDEQRRLDLNLAREFLTRLLADEAEERAGLAYALVLLLARKRRIRIVGSRREGERELLQVRWPRTEDEEPIEVAVPPMDDEKVERVQAELERLFGDDDDNAQPEPPAPDTPAPA